MSVKRLWLEYDTVSERGTFSPGDTLSGQVIVLTSKETKVQSFLVKAKGKAEVGWSEQDGQTPALHKTSDKKVYFYFEHIILQDKKGDGSEIISAGRNVFPFTFKIPNRDMPSSFEGKWGRITYSLRAKLTVSIWMVYKAKIEVPFLTKAEFPFVSKSEMIIIGLKEPQYGTRISFCASGKVTMNVTSGKMGLKQGEAMEVSAEVLNDSTHAVTPRFYLCEKQTFVTPSKRIVHTNDVLFGTGEPVAAAASQTVTRALTVAPGLPPTFFNCSMMKLEYRLKVTLDIPQARDAEIKLPLVVLLGQAAPPEKKQKRCTWYK